MRTRVILAVALIALAVPASGVAADLAFAPGFATSVLVLEGVIEGVDAAGIRKAIDSQDAGGNGDGSVSHGEAVQFTVRFRGTFRSEMEVAVSSGNLTLDGRPPLSIVATNVTLDGAQGPIESQEPIRTRLEAQLRWQPGPGPRHVLGLGTEAAAQPMQLTVHAPEGHIVESATGGARSADGRMAEYSNTQGAGLHRVTFAPEAEPKGTPGLGLAVAAAALLLLARSRAKATNR